jgi:outer membrane protein
MRNRRLVIGFVAPVCGGVLLAASSAHGEEFSPPGGVTVFGWYLSNGRIGAGVEPDYLGSNDYRFAPSGSVSFSRKGDQPGPWGAPDDGFSVGLVGDKTRSAGLVGRWRSGRGDDGDLRGLDNVDGALEAGGFAYWWPAGWLRVRGEVRHGLGGHDHWSADLGADAVERTGPWVLSVGPRLAWADDDFTRIFFGVTPAEAARSPLGIAPFAAGGSFWSPGALASAEYRVNRFWSFTAVGQYRRLTGDAADSPLVAGLGSRDQFSASLSVSYAFVP